MYRVTYEQGNGYHCHCCRRSWNNDIDFKTQKEVIDYILKMRKICNGTIKKTWDDEDDWILQEVREIKDDDLTDKYEKIVNDIIKNEKSLELRNIKIKNLLKNN